MSDIAVRMTTDGSSRGNPGPGGWAVYLEAFNGKPEPFATKLLSGSIPETTNNLAELEAVYQGLSTLKPSAKYVEVHTDSLNVIGWLYGWNRKIKEPDPAKKFKQKDPQIREACERITRLVGEKQLSVVFFKAGEDLTSNLFLVDAEAKRQAIP